MPKLNQVSELLENVKERLRSVLSLKSLAPVDLTGLDIEPDSLKLLKLNRKETPPRVENFAVSSLPEGIFVKDEIKNHAALSDALKDLFQQAGVKSNQVALAIPRSKAITKTISIDKRLTEEEIESRAWIEANRHFPDLVGDIYLDFFVNGVSPQDPSQLEITLVASRKEQIKTYLDVLRAAGLQAKIIDVDAYALERSLTFLVSTESSVVALLNLNLNLITLIVVSQNHLVYAHDQGFDGQRLKTQLNDYFKDPAVDNTDQNTLLTNETYQGLLRNGLLTNLRHSMQFFYSSRPNIRIQKLILAGDLATTPGIAAFIQKEIGIETSIADLPAHLTLDANINAALFKTHAPSLVLTCGLALTDGKLL